MSRKLLDSPANLQEDVAAAMKVVARGSILVLASVLFCYLLKFVLGEAYE